MAREPVERLISKTSHWPLKQRRRYLIDTLQLEKGRWRRKQIATALAGITTRVLRQELRGRKQ